MRYWRISAVLWVLSAPALAHTAHHHATSTVHHGKKVAVRHGHHGKAQRVTHGPSQKSMHHAAGAHHATRAGHAHAHTAHFSPAHKLAGPSMPGDHSAEDLNGRSLDAAQAGQPFSPTPH